MKANYKIITGKRISRDYKFISVHNWHNNNEIENYYWDDIEAMVISYSCIGVWKIKTLK